MKKSLILLAIISSFLLSSCKKEEDKSSATVYISLRVGGKLWKHSSGTTIYMFREDKIPFSDSFKPELADKKSAVEGTYATFDLKHPDVKADKQTTLSFAVFDRENNCIGTTAVTVKIFDKKEGHIELLVNQQS